MTKINWDKKYSSGNKLLDEQNKILILLLNELMKIIYIGGTRTEFEKTFNSLIIKAKLHFETEENIMRNIKYNLYEMHKYQHSKCINRLELFKNEYLLGANIFFEFQRHIVKWIDGHVMISDKKMLL